MQNLLANIKIQVNTKIYVKDPEKAAKSHRELSRRESELERLMQDWEKISE